MKIDYKSLQVKKESVKELKQLALDLEITIYEVVELLIKNFKGGKK
jgi:hypothetical protein